MAGRLPDHRRRVGGARPRDRGSRVRGARPGWRAAPAADPRPPDHGRGPSTPDEMARVRARRRRRSADGLDPRSRTCCASWRRGSSPPLCAATATSTRRRTRSRRRSSPPPTAGRATGDPGPALAWLHADRHAPADRSRWRSNRARVERERSVALSEPVTSPQRSPTEDDSLVAPVPVLPPVADASVGHPLTLRAVGA